MILQKIEGDEWGLKDAFPEHLEAMFQKACQDGVSKGQARRLAELLDQAVFSWSDQDVGKTDLVKHSIEVQEGTLPVSQCPSSPPPLYWLRPQKEQET